MTDATDNDGSNSAPAAGLSVKRVLPVAIIGAAMVLFFVFDLHHYFTFEALKTNRQQLLDFYAANQTLTALLFVAGYAAVVALSIPGAVWMTLMAGFLFGTVTGTVIVVVSATLGSLIVFLAARYAVGDLLIKKAGPFVQRMEAGFQDNAFSYMMFLRLVPAFPFWLVNLVPAFLNVSTPVFLLATVLGIAPGSFVFSSVGSGLGQVLDTGGTPNLGIIFEPHVIGPILGLAAISLIPVIYKKYKGASPDAAATAAKAVSKDNTP